MRLALLLLAACNLHDDLQRCGDLLCPPTATCAADRCIEAASLAACAGVDEGADCATLRVADGVCSASECIARGCGNGVLESGELCDDGNRTSDDGCADDCRGLDACPPLGTAPSFRGLLQQLTTDNCSLYSESRDINLAVLGCLVGVSATYFTALEGPIGGPFVPAGLDREYSSALLAPEGDRLFVKYVKGPVEHWIMKRVAGSWQKTATLTTIPESESLGRPSRGPDARILSTNGNVLTEYVLSDTTATFVRTHFPGLAYVQDADLSADGRRMYVTGSTGQLGTQDAAYVAERATLDADFGELVQMSDLDATAQIFVTENCDRMYVTQFQTLFYARQTP